MHRLPLAVAVVALAFAAPATAETPPAPQGALSAAARGPVPAGAAIAVRAPDASDRSAAMREALAEALAARGYVVRADAPLVLSFALATGAAGQARPRLELLGEGGSSSSPEFGLRLNLPLTSKSPPSTQAGPRRLVLILSERRDRRLWEAEVTPKPAAGVDPFDTLLALIPAAVDNLGRDVSLKFIP